MPWQPPLADHVSLGLARDVCKDVILTDRQRSLTTYIRGISGCGKSRLMTRMIFQDILRWQGAGLIDPTGSIYRALESFVASLLARMEVDEELEQLIGDIRRFHFIDFSRDDHGYTFNPLFIDWAAGETPEQVVGDFLKTIERGLKGDLTETRRLRSVLEAGSTLVAIAGGTPLDIMAWMTMPAEQLRDRISRLDQQARDAGRYIPESILEYMYRFILRLMPRDQLDRVESSVNALAPWLNDPIVRKFFNCKRGSLDIGEIINEGEYLFCNVSMKNFATTPVLGNLLVNAIQRKAISRPPELRSRSFFLYVDEFHLFCADEQFAVATATVRQFGLRLVLAHQAADQPPLNTEEGQGILKTIMANSSVKILFRLGYDDAVRVAPEVFPLTGKRMKRVVRTVTRSRSEAVARGSSRSVAEALSDGTSTTFTATLGESKTHQVTYTEGKGVTRTDNKTLGLTVTAGDSFSQVHSKSHGLTITTSDGITTVEGEATAKGEAQTTATTTSHGTSDQTTQSDGRNWGDTHTSNAGFSHTPDVHYFDPIAGQMTVLPGRSGWSNNEGRGQQDGGSTSSSSAQGVHESHGESLAKAISTVVTASRSFANSKQLSKGQSKTTTIGDSQTQSHSKALAETVGEAFSTIFNYSQAMSKALAVSRTVAAGSATSQSRTVTVSFAESTTTTTAEATAVSDTVECYPMAEEQQLNAQRLAGLPPQQAFVVTTTGKTYGHGEFGEGDHQVTEIKAHFVPDEFPTEVFGPEDYTGRLRQLTQPAQPLLEAPKKAQRDMNNVEPDGFA